MHRPRSWLALLAFAPMLAGCASSSLDMAPDRADRPWTPDTTTNGEINPGTHAPEHSPNTAYVLPSNPTLGAIPAPPSGLVPGHVYSLAELIDIAQSNNPVTRIAWDEARDAALAAGIARSAFLPNLSAGVIGGYQTGPNRASLLGASSNGSVRADGTISAVSLQWLLFDFGERSAIVDAALQGSVVTNIAFTAAHQQVIYKVSLAFYAHAAAQARVETAARALKNALDIQVAAEARFGHGEGTVVDVAEARQATAQAKFAQVQADGAAQNTYISLLAAMGISPLTKIQIADTADRKLSPAMTGSIEEVVSAALARRPDTLTAYAAHQASLDNLRAAQAEFMPKLFVAATGSYATGSLNVTGIPGIAPQPPTLNLSPQGLGATVLVGISIPLYDGGVREANVERARTDVDKAEARLQEITDDAIQQVVAAGNTLRTSLAAYAAAQALTAAAHTTFDGTLQAYRHGVGSITAATGAETRLLGAEDAETGAYNSALSAAATLALTVGTLGAAPQ